MLRFLLDGECLSVLIKLYDTIFSRVTHIISENSRSLFNLGCTHQNLWKALSVENIITEHQCHTVISDEIGSDNKRICQSPRFVLNSIRHLKPQLLTGAKQFFKYRKITLCRDDQDLTDPCQHQCGQRIVDHRLIINRHDLFWNRFGQRVQSGTGTAC